MLLEPGILQRPTSERSGRDARPTPQERRPVAVPPDAPAGRDALAALRFSVVAMHRQTDLLINSPE